MDECLNKIEVNSKQIEDIVNNIIGDSTSQLDEYINTVKSLISNTDYIKDSDLDRIVLDIPVFLYYAVKIAQELDIKKGLSLEEAKYSENDALLNATGTVSEKQAKAANASIKNRIVQLAYKTASSTIQNKINITLEILNSAKKVQQRRLEEMRLTKIAGNSVAQ